MPTFNSALYNLEKPTRANPARLTTANIAGGELNLVVIQYPLAGTEAAADVINLCILPKGAVPVPGLSRVVCSQDPGTTLTLDVGTVDATTGDPDGWADGIVLSAGGIVEFASVAGTTLAWLLAETPLEGDTGSANSVVAATVASANTLTAGTILYFHLVYKVGR